MKSKYLLILSAIPLAAAITGPVRVDSGQLSGAPAADPSVTVFKGVPFAAPPVGDLRWRAPKPVRAWQGVRKADHFGANCMQYMLGVREPWTSEFMAHGLMSEDCLYLNVWTAASAASERRAVVVFIHGGGFNEGSGSIAAYDGENLAKKGVVVVTLNYRMTILGFFTHPELAKESDRNACGNYGLLDQVAALEWVQKNIAAFGGDPKRVTIMGQSAGASSVHNLTASPLAKGLFTYAIAESGSGVRPNIAGRTLAQAQDDGVKFAEAKGARSLKELRAMDAAELMAPVDGRSTTFRPVVDGWYLPKEVGQIFAEGRQNDVPTLTGLNFDEGSSNLTYGKIPAAEYQKQIHERFGPLADDFFKLYPVSTQADAGESQKLSARELGMISMHLWAVNRAKTGRTKVFTYIFDHPEPGPKKDLYMAFHTSEIPYVMNNLDKSDRPWTADDRRIADQMSDYWVNFIKTGDPNGNGLLEWPAFRANEPVTMELGDRTGPRPIADKAKIEFFEKYFASPAAARASRGR